MAQTRVEALLAEGRRRAGKGEVPRSYLDFCEWNRVKLTDGQRVFSLVAYDGKEPKQLRGADRKLARRIFGDLETIPKAAREVVVVVAGARAGKTYTVEALRLLHLALTVAIPELAPGEVASAPIIQPDKDLAGQALGYVKGAVEANPALKAMVVGETTESIDLRRPDGKVVEIVCRAASARGRTGRGRTLVGAAMGEAAFFRDKNFQVNDEEVYRALTPRIVEGGQLIISSTPWAQLGLLHDLFAANHPDPTVAGLNSRPTCDGTALAAHAPTLVFRSSTHLEAMVERERKRDPDNASREYDAQFMSAGTSAFFDPLAINAAIDEALQLPLKPKAGDEVAAGGDFGFDKNSSTLAISYRRGKTVLTADIREQKPDPGEPLKPSAVTKSFADVAASHWCTGIMADKHYRRAVEEFLEESDLAFIDAPSAPDVAFVRANALLREKRVKLPNHPRLLRQLREVMFRRRPGGGVSIILPQWRTGEHGDLAAAWVLSVYQVSGDVVIDTTKPEPGTDAWADAEEARVVREHDAEQTRQHWERTESDGNDWWMR